MIIGVHKEAPLLCTTRVEYRKLESGWQTSPLSTQLLSVLHAIQENSAERERKQSSRQKRDNALYPLRKEEESDYC